MSTNLDLDDARRVREAALGALAARVPAEVVVGFRLLRRAVDGICVLAGGVAVGEPERCRAILGLEGRPVTDLGYGLRHPVSLDAPRRSLASEAPVHMQEAFYSPAGIAHVMGVSLTVGDHFDWAVVLLRTDAHGPFSDDDLDEMRSFLPELRHAAREARDAEVIYPAVTGRAVLGPDGRIAFVSPSLERDLDVVAALGPLARAWAMGDRRTSRMIGNLEVTLEPLGGPLGDAVHLEVAPTAPMEVAEAFRLTKLKLRVAALAVDGLSVPQIAAELERSPETIRTHLKRIYEQLGVGSRVELAQACTDLWS